MKKLPAYPERRAGSVQVLQTHSLLGRDVYAANGDLLSSEKAF